MNAILMPGGAAALPEQPDTPENEAPENESPESPLRDNASWEIDRALMFEQSDRRAWRAAFCSLATAALAIATVFVQGPLRQVVEIPIVVDRVTGETTIQQRLSAETVPPLEALDKHKLATFVRAREGYQWMFLQRDFDQVARMAVPAVFADYNRQFDGDAALHKRIGATEDWRINIVSIRLAPSGRRSHKEGNRGEATVTYDKVVRATDHKLPEVSTRHVASVVYKYQPLVFAKEQDRIENPFGFVVTAYRSDPEINTAAAGGRT